MIRINKKGNSIYITKLKRKEIKEMEENIENETKNIMSNVYEHPFITCLLFSTFCCGIATIVESLKK